jgi:putative glutamine amidotransferase
MADMAVIASLIDGWLIPGGDDIDASHFGEVNHPKVDLQDPARFEAEATLYKVAPADLPILGICYGCQFLNVVRGGSLIQHLPDVVGHEGHTGGTMQKYDVDPASKLGKVISTSSIEGRSYHHQAVKDLGANLSITSRSEDGTVEALEATDRPWVIGVQWHPERSFEDPPTRKIFDTLIQAAAAYKADKERRA